MDVQRSSSIAIEDDEKKNNLLTGPHMHKEVANIKQRGVARREAASRLLRTDLDGTTLGTLRLAWLTGAERRSTYKRPVCCGCCQAFVNGFFLAR
jgi:hypothetical protein